jgi:hypothetical protein
MKDKSKESVPKSTKHIFDEIASFTDAFCKQHLNPEYADLCRRLAATLSRKRPSPLLRGKPLSWASGRINFLFDKSQSPHLKASELCALLGVSEQTASSKAKYIMDNLNIIQMDPRWCLPSKIDKNPLAWMIQVNGLIVDARWMPREVQEEAYRLGLIPYIPEEAT